MASSERSAPHPSFVPHKPRGQPSRGKTARNRLRRVDNFLLRYDPVLLRRGGPSARTYFVDLGYGAEPVTTLDGAVRLRTVQPQLPVLGVELDPARVAAAQPFADPLTSFRVGGFNLPLDSRPDGEPERACVIRAFHVLRQYEEAAVPEAWWLLGQRVARLADRSACFQHQFPAAAQPHAILGRAAQESDSQDVVRRADSCIFPGLAAGTGHGSGLSILGPATVVRGCS